MIVRDTASFEDIDWVLGQEVPAATTVTAPAPAPVVAPPPPVPAPVLTPVVSLGPVRVMARSGSTPYGIRATIRTPYRVIRDMEVPAGLFQAVIPKADFDAGATIIFGSSSHGSIEVPAVKFVCAVGFQDQNGVLTQMSQTQCPFTNQYFDDPRPVQAPPSRRDYAPRRQKLVPPPEEAPTPAAPAAPATFAPTTTGTNPWMIGALAAGGLLALFLVLRT